MNGFDLVLSVLNGVALASIWFMYVDLKSKKEATEAKKEELEKTLQTLNTVHNSMAIEVQKIHEKIGVHDIMLTGMKTKTSSFVNPMNRASTNG